MLFRSDVHQERIDVLSRVPGQPNFLRPDPKSPLATGGAGGELPSYVGAVPPAGVQSWDWIGMWKKRTYKK